MIVSEDFELCEHSLVADHGKELQSLKEVEVDVSRVVADEEIVLANVVNNLWKEGFVKLDRLCLVVLIVAEADDLPSELVE